VALSFTTVVEVYQDKIKNLPIILRGSFRHSVVGIDSLLNKMFFGFLFSDCEKAMKFVQER
jgi:hypothetical protein